MSSWKMIVDFGKLREIAQEIEQISDHVQEIAEHHGQGVICGIKAAWGGENADAFTEKEVKLVNRIYEVRLDLSEVAKQLEEKAEQIYRLEKGNVLTAKTRIY